MTTDTSAEALERLARKLYGEWADSQGIHCNRFPAWNELSENARIKWRTEAAEKRRAREGVTDDKAAAWMFPSDLKDLELSETSAEAFSIKMIRLGEETVPLFTRAALESVWKDGRDAKDAARYRWLAEYPNLYTVADLLRADQYATLTRACDALMTTAHSATQDTDHD